MWNEFLNHFGGMKRAKTIGLLVVAMATKKQTMCWPYIAEHRLRKIRHFSNIKLILVRVYKLLIYHFAFSLTN